jgi:hypothetical protein
MTICAIMQPTYLPWLGYFALINIVDVFVFLDDVQLSKQSWQTRNRIKRGPDDALILSVPIRHAGAMQERLIRDVEIDDSGNWANKHLKSIEQYYRKAPYFAEAMDIVEPPLRAHGPKLCDLNITLIATVAERIKIGGGNHIRSSDIAEKSADRRDRLVDICKAVGADTYLSPAGAAGYLGAEDGEAQFAAHGMSLLYQRYEHPTYPQINGAFLSHMCVLDLIANVGVAAAGGVIRSGIRPSSAAQLETREAV